MPIFSRRRLQAMLDDLMPHLNGSKGQDILSRLENKRTEQALPAEMELALLWAIAKTGDLEIEPEWWSDTRRPDAYSETLILKHPTVVEIAALRDTNKVTGEEDMGGVSNEISKFVNQIKKNAGDFLFYRFAEESGYRNGSYFRRRLAPSNFKLSKDAQSKIEAWIKGGVKAGDELLISERYLHVTITMRDRKQFQYGNFWSSMPPEMHSINHNSLFDLIQSKESQIKGAPEGTIRLLFLADAGSQIFNKIGRSSEINFYNRSVSAREVIRNFMSLYNKHLDWIVTFAPIREILGTGHSFMTWSIAIFANDKIVKIIESSINSLVSSLPKPRFEGYQARSLHRLGMYKPTSNKWYLSMIFVGNMIKKEYKIKVPARALLDLLAGRISESEFRSYINPNNNGVNYVEALLKKGLTVSSAEMSKRNIDDDDDHIILSFSDDPSVRDLRLNKK